MKGADTVNTMVDDPIPAASVEFGGYRLETGAFHSSNSMRGLLNLRSPILPQYGEDITTLGVNINYETKNRVRIRIADVEEKRWQVPDDVVPLNKAVEEIVSKDDCDYTVKVAEEPFGFCVQRRRSDEKVFDTMGLRLVFKDQYLELSTHLPEHANIYGLGENVAKLRRVEGSKTTIWARDAGCPEGENIYGCHPFYIELREGKAHGVLLLNSNGMDVELSPTNDRLTYKVIGGIFDFYIFLGDTPGEVVQQYHELIGRPYMIPYWSLGMHQCRWGYDNLDMVKEVIAGYKEARIPLEAMWIDIDYMDKFKCFTYDPIRFPKEEVADFAKKLHDVNQKLVMMLDPGIKKEDGYHAYEEGMKRDIFLKRHDHAVFIGHVWPGKTLFPDWFHPHTQDYWTDMIQRWVDIVPIDGIWIDMNEVANFAHGDCSALPDEEATPMLPTAEDTIDEMVEKEQSHLLPYETGKTDEAENEDAFGILNPPYKINNAAQFAPLHHRTSAMDAIHAKNVIEYDAHNLFGHMECLATNAALRKIYPDRKPFLLSRSTFVGSGTVGSHWLGDNSSRWQDLYWSIPGMLNFQFFGIPMVGADIGGFSRSVKEPLLRRWTQLGCFYPFARNHNSLHLKPQEPYVYAAVAESARKYCNIRYAMLPYWYTLFWKSSTRGETVVRPLWMEHHGDKNTYDIDTQFYVGNAVLVTPVLKENAIEVKAYFPKGRWYNFVSYELMIHNHSEGSHITLDAPLDVLPLHLRGGTILPLFKDPASTTTDCRTSCNYSLIVALDDNGKAHGDLYLDDDKPLDVAKWSLLEFTAEDKSLSASGIFGFSPPNVLNQVTILGITGPINTVEIDGVPIKEKFFRWHSRNQFLVVDDIQLPLTCKWKITWA